MTRKPIQPEALADRLIRGLAPQGYGVAALFAVAVCGIASAVPGFAQAPPAPSQAPASDKPAAADATDKPAGKATEKGKPATKEEEDDDDDDDDKPPAKAAAADQAPGKNGASTGDKAADKSAADKSADEKSADKGDDDEEDKHPQAVRVGDLIGRAVIAPEESQNLLGHVRKLVRDGEGEVNLVMNYGGYFGTSLGSHLVCVSVDDVALTGYQIQAKEISAEDLAGLPVCDGSADKPVEANETIKVNLAKPAH